MTSQSDDNTYYVNEYGVRAKNQWVSVENEDSEDVNGEEVETLWYYFGDNGKAYKATSDDSGDKKKKTCPDATGSRTYFFDTNGHMLSGWVEKDNELYYCGTENEGWAYTGWQYLEPSDELASENYDDMVWFNFKSSGKARKAAAGKTIDWYSKGRYYTFNEYGIMTSDWYGLAVSGVATDSIATSNNASKNAYTSEDGSKGTGWIYTENAAESDSYWYYLVSVKSTDGKNTYRNIPFNSQSGDEAWRAKTIKGKTYIFNSNGEMEDGLVILGNDGNGTTGKTNVYDANGDATFDNKGGAVSKAMADGVYYFNEGNGSVNGQMVTGKTTVTKDGEDYYYYFDKTTGRAVTDIVKDGVVYGHDGERIDAEDGNTNAIVTLDHDTYYNKKVNGTTCEYIKAGSRVIVSSTGKLRTSGTVKVDGVKCQVNASADGNWNVAEDVE